MPITTIANNTNPRAGKTNKLNKPSIVVKIIKGNFKHSSFFKHNFIILIKSDSMITPFKKFSINSPVSSIIVKAFKMT
jgi:hypothetical protein